jgi:lipopolysaccharide transport system ATP-binding protein
MSDVVIQVESLSKRYRIGMREEQSSTPQGMLLDLLYRPVKNIRNLMRLSQFHSDDEADVFWALRDISFTVQQGEVLGIIGRNGAGKSTLLKVLSRITAPTSGRARLRGRVSSLLEVGTGFNPELTGRENVYLNGTILGMRRAEVARKFDEIVDFAGVEKFIDTPVKRYSSGMKVRLAFAVAAHLEPEILIIDEVLAVGDFEFQAKCLGKMQDATSSGRTVLFVSHNMQAVLNLCPKTMLLQNGQIHAYGDTRSVVDNYLAGAGQHELNTEIVPEMHLHYPPDLEIFQVELHNRHGELTNTLLIDEPFLIRIFYRINQPELRYFFGIRFQSNKHDLTLAEIVNTESGLPSIQGQQGTTYSISVQLKNVFMPGEYSLDLNVKEGTRQVDLIRGLSFSVVAASLNTFRTYRGGIVKLDTQWTSAEECACPTTLSSPDTGQTNK